MGTKEYAVVEAGNMYLKFYENFKLLLLQILYTPVKTAFTTLVPSP